MQQITPDTRAGVEGREDEQRLEHDREMIPEIEPAIADRVVKNLRHADRQSGRSAGPAEQGLLADGVGKLIHLPDRDRKTERGDLRCGFLRRAFNVHAQVNTGVERAGRDQGHDRHE